MEQIGSEAGIHNETQNKGEKDLGIIKALQKTQTYGSHCTVEQILHDDCKNPAKTRQYPHTTEDRTHTTRPPSTPHQQSGLTHIPMLPQTQRNSCPLPPPLPCTPKCQRHTSGHNWARRTQHCEAIIPEGPLPCIIHIHCKLRSLPIRVW